MNIIGALLLFFCKCDGVWQLLWQLWELLCCRRQSIDRLCRQAASSGQRYSPALVRRLAELGDAAGGLRAAGFERVLGEHVAFLAQYRRVHGELVALKSTRYDPNNAEHERLLLALWTALKQTAEAPAAVSPEWKEIGFQGTNPATDFRAMGLLGLVQLLHFADDEGGQAARSTLSMANHPSYWFPFACVGINITAWLLDCYASDALVPYFCRCGVVDVQHFHRLYARVFHAFGAYYVRSRPADIMAFGSLFAAFRQRLEANSFDVIE